MKIIQSGHDHTPGVHLQIRVTTNSYSITKYTVVSSERMVLLD